MEWITIEHRGEIVDVADWLDGILFRDANDPSSPSLFAQGWHVVPQRGDMDGPNVRRNTITHPTYKLELTAEK